MAPTALPAADVATTSTSPPPPNGSQAESTNASSAPPSTAMTAATPPIRSLSSRDINDHVTRPRFSLSTPPISAASPQLNPYHDGRIRNPVPSKLKGKTDGRKGNFSVMQIDVPRPEMTQRDLAAKRTSEGTAAAARLASTQGYRHPKRPRPNPPPLPPPTLPRAHPPLVLPAPPRPIPQPPPLPPAAPADIAPVANTAPQQAATQQTSNSGLSPGETKTEQARLLTLLRSLHPVLVVDQLCKALAYFGGIPGAPPPTDGAFPQSASTNGSGSLFVAWIAEIFPHLDNADQPAGTQFSGVIPPVGASNASSASVAAPLPVKRSRGRPKGSKSSKVRKDKGIKKKAVTGETDQTNGTPAIPTTSTEQAPHASHPSATVDQEPAGSVTQAAPVVQPATPYTGKKRGRPKGSKNKPKANPGTHDGADQTNSVNPNATQSSNPSIESPLAHKTTSSHLDAFSPSNAGITSTSSNGEAVNPNQVDAAVSFLPTQEPAMTSDVESSHDHRPQSTPLSNQSHPQNFSRKRKPSQQTTQANSQAATAARDALQVHETVSRSSASHQTQQAKRRRVSQETSQNPSLSGTEAQSTEPQMSASPSLAPSGHMSSSTSSFDSQTQMNALGVTANQRPQQLPQHQRQHLQQQHQNLNLHQFNPKPNPNQNQNRNENHHQQQQQSQQQTSNMSSDQSSQTQPMSSSAINRPRSRLPGAPGRIPANMTPQAFFQQQQQQQQRQQQQRQMANQFSQSAGHSFSRTMGSNSPTQFQQQSMTAANSSFNARQPIPQQQQQQQHPQPQSTGSTPTPNMSQFQDFSGQNYLDMDYTMNPDAAAAFGGHTQLEAALAEPDMRDRIYHAIGRQ